MTDTARKATHAVADLVEENARLREENATLRATIESEMMEIKKQREARLLAREQRLGATSR